MSQRQGRAYRRRLSLSVRLSLLLLGAALLPSIAVVGITNYLARTSLIEQGRTTLSTYASARVALLDSYLKERVLDGAALASLETVPKLLACQELPADQIPPSITCDLPSIQGYELSVARALIVGTHRDQNYTTWSMYDGSWHLVLSSDQQTMTTGGTPVPKEDQTPVSQGNPWISAVYEDPKASSAYIHLYYPIVPDIRQPASSTNPVLGALQATLRLDTIWGIVLDKGKLDANNDGSYAFVTDANGVRIADGHADELFTGIAPLDPAAQQVISSEQRFGSSGPVAIDDLPQVASQLASPDAETSFQSVASPNSKTLYQFVRIRLQTVPWTYFVLSPLSTVTKVADDQVRTSVIIAGVVALLAMLLGLLIGTRTAAPMQRSVADLRSASAALNMMAAKQQNSASEQLWVVDACRTGLESVRYLSDAMHQAAHRVVEAGNWFGQYWDRLTEDQAQRTVQHLRDLAQYIEEAARRQWASSERLDKAITVTTQVSDQLASGASAAAESAGQLETVVGNLQRVVGGRQARQAEHEAELSETYPSESPQQALPAPSWHSQGYAGQMAPDAPVMHGGRAPDRGAPVGGYPTGGAWGQGGNGTYGPEWSGRATNGPAVRVWEDR